MAGCLLQNAQSNIGWRRGPRIGRSLASSRDFGPPPRAKQPRAGTSLRKRTQYWGPGGIPALNTLVRTEAVLGHSAMATSTAMVTDGPLGLTSIVEPSMVRFESPHHVQRYLLLAASRVDSAATRLRLATGSPNCHRKDPCPQSTAPNQPLALAHLGSGEARRTRWRHHQYGTNPASVNLPAPRSKSRGLPRDKLCLGQRF